MVEVLVNETFDMISALSDQPQTKMLYEQVVEAMEGHDSATVITVLVQLISTVNIDEFINGDGGVCTKCVRRSLTEILQSIRKINDDVLDRLPEADH